MSPSSIGSVEKLYAESERSFHHWEVTKDVVDEVIDLILNYRQSGHPGGSRSKVHVMLATLLSGAMRWDVLRPWRRFCDRFVLSAGHTVPLIYSILSVMNEAMRARHEATGDEAFAFPEEGKYALTWEDLLGFRNRGGLPGHAEMAGKTLFLKWNTGPSGHGMPAAAGEALALKHAGCEDVKVFAIEGEGGLTPGGSAETRNSAWGLGLENLVFLVDWNDFGIDPHPVSSVVYGTPKTWFESFGWRSFGTEQGSEWAPVARAVLEATRSANPEKLPSMAWVKTRKGRGYLKYDNVSHGSPHARNSELFWQLRKEFMKKYGVEYEGVDQPAPSDPAAMRDQMAKNLQVAMSALRKNEELVNYLSDRLVALAREVPDEIPTLNLGARSEELVDDPRLYDFEHYPESMWAKPGTSQPNRAGFAAWGAWVNTFARKEYERPLVIACSADLAESTNIAGFAKDFDGVKGWGWYNRNENTRGTLLPQTITEFANAGICVGLSSVNLARDPMKEFSGFWSACSTYGSFSYLKYGLMRLYSQLAQDCELKIGKVIWVAGHSGPETADDSRTHFGIFAPGVTQLFPEGAVIDLHPWEYNEVPVALAAALKQKAAIVALHLTRPAVEIPDRKALGIPSHFEAARGAYVMRPYREGQPRMGTVLVQGTSPTANLIKVLPKLDEEKINVKIVQLVSKQLFDLQDKAYRDSVLSVGDRWDSMVISNSSLRTTRDWVTNPVVADYSMTSDHDGRWRTGGSLDEITEEARLAPQHLLAGIQRFARERSERLETLKAAVEAAEKHA